MANDLTHLVLITTLYGRSKFRSHLTDEETEADAEAIHQRSHKQRKW